MSITEPGKYLARCIDDPLAIRWGRAKSGSEQIALTFALVDNGKPTNATIEWVGGFGSDDSAKITLRALRACGWSGDDLLDLRGINDCDVEIDVQRDEYQGESRLRVRWVNKPGSGRLTFKEQLDDRSKKALAARMRSLVSGSAQRATGRRWSDDDLPF
jgi:hypothetical protein